MNEIDFRLWLDKNNINKKVSSDIVSRLRRIEKEFNGCDIDAEYHRDRCAFLLSLFDNKGINDGMKKFPHSSLPVGKYQLSTYKYALNKYIYFLKEFTSEQK